MPGADLRGRNRQGGSLAAERGRTPARGPEACSASVVCRRFPLKPPDVLEEGTGRGAPRDSDGARRAPERTPGSESSRSILPITLGQLVFLPSSHPPETPGVPKACALASSWGTPSGASPAAETTSLCPSQPPNLQVPSTELKAMGHLPWSPTRVTRGHTPMGGQAGHEHRATAKISHPVGAGHRTASTAASPGCLREPSQGALLQHHRGQAALLGRSALFPHGVHATGMITMD